MTTKIPLCASWTLATFVALAACDSREGDMTEELYDEAIRDGAYKSWTVFPNNAKPAKSSGHGGVYVRAYYNDDAAPAFGKWEGSFPDGTILVKEQFKDEAATKSAGHTVMWKVEGFDPEHSDWYWAAFDPAGSVVRAGKVADCIDCHGATAAMTDWVMTPFMMP